MNTSIKAQYSRLPLFAAASHRHFPAWIDAGDGRLLSPVTPRVRDSFALRCVFSRSAQIFASEPLHARRAH